MHPANGWTGGSATALQSALRLSNEGFAAHLGIAVRTIAAWHQKPSVCPRSEMQQLLEDACDVLNQPYPPSRPPDPTADQLEQWRHGPAVPSADVSQPSLAEQSP